MRFLKPGMQVSQAQYGHSALVTNKGVFWKCGRCGMKNAIRDEGCRMCRTPNF